MSRVNACTLYIRADTLADVERGIDALNFPDASTRKLAMERVLTYISMAYNHAATLGDQRWSANQHYLVSTTRKLLCDPLPYSQHVIHCSDVPLEFYKYAHAAFLVSGNILLTSHFLLDIKFADGGQSWEEPDSVFVLPKMEPNWLVSYSASCGRVASVPAGVNVMNDNVAWYHCQGFCHNCMAVNPTLVCMNCEFGLYCGLDCLRADRTRHAYACHAFRVSHPKRGSRRIKSKKEVIYDNCYLTPPADPCIVYYPNPEPPVAAGCFPTIAYQALPNEPHPKALFVPLSACVEKVPHGLPFPAFVPAAGKYLYQCSSPCCQYMFLTHTILLFLLQTPSLG